MGRNECGKDGRKQSGKPEKTIIVDEFGDLGKGKRSSKRFGVVATVTRDPKGFGRIAEKFKKKAKVKGELKYRSSDPSMRKSMMEEISKSDAKIHAAVSNKNNASGKDLYRKTTESLMHDVMERDETSSYDVIYDRHSALNEDSAIRLTRKVGDQYKKKVNVRMMDSSQSLELQTHDFITGAIGTEAETKDSKYADILRSKLNVRILKTKK